MRGWWSESRWAAKTYRPRRPGVRKAGPVVWVNLGSTRYISINEGGRGVTVFVGRYGGQWGLRLYALGIVLSAGPLFRG